MDESISYKKAFLHYFSSQYPEINIDWLLETLTSLYSGKDKVWASLEYLNSVILNYLIAYELLDNPDVVFFALVFKYIQYDDYILDANIVNELNIKSFENFLKDVSFDLNVKGVKYLLRSSGFLPNDLNITENDYNFYHDILLYSKPLNVFEDRYTCYYYDDLLKIQNYFKGEKPRLKIEKEQIILILETMQDRNYCFKTSLFKINHSNKVNKFISHYYS